MNNLDVKDLVNNCEEELEKIKEFIESNKFSPMQPFLTKYTVIKVCGTLEQSFKILISDFTCKDQKPQVKKFIDESFRRSSMNPNMENIRGALGRFDENWKDNFNDLVKNDENSTIIVEAIKSLNTNRNSFAHGGNITPSFNDIYTYFQHSKKIIKYIEDSLI